MISVNNSTSVKELPLSVRTVNCLLRGHIDTLGQLLAIEDEETLLKVKNAGMKTAREVFAFKEALLNGTHPECVYGGTSCFTEKAKERETVSLPADMPLAELGLSTRSYNGLMRTGITTVGAAAVLTEEELSQIKHIGKDSVAEILKKLSAFHIAEPGKSCGHIEAELLAAQAEKCFGNTAVRWMTVIGRILKDRKEISPDTLYYLFGETEEAASAIRNTVLTWLDEAPDGEHSVFELENLLPPQLINTTALQEQLNVLESTGTVMLSEDGGYVTRRFPSVRETLENLTEDGQEIVSERLLGRTLEQIAQAKNLTRERIRQKLVKYFHALPRVYEDKFRLIFDSYQFSEESFCLITGEPAETFFYLQSVCEKKNVEKRSLEELTDDETVPEEYRLRAEKIIYRGYISLDGVRIKRERPELIRFFVRRNCTDNTDFHAFCEGYNAFLKEIGETEEKLYVRSENRTYENLFSRCDFALSNVHHSFRYYDIAQCDAEKLIADLNLEELMDTEFSTLKLFREHPDTMAEFDIRDQYELHNLLSKISLPENLKAVFKRMPIVSFGKGDRYDQMLDLLIETAPIGAQELAQKYEERYGFQTSSLLANEFGRIDQYFYKGMYRIDEKELPSAHREELARILTEDCYSVADIRKIYRRAFADADTEAINSYTMKGLGFLVYAGFVVKANYGSCGAYIKSLLDGHDYVDLEAIGKTIRNTGDFSSALNDRRFAGELIEYSPRRYISMSKLESSGITREMIEDYRAAAEKFLEKNTFFTVDSLYAAGFSHPLDELGFDKLFYASLLAWDKIRFSFRRIGTGFLLFNAPGRNIDMSRFIRSILEKETRMDIDALEKRIRETYGLNMPREKLPALLRDAGLYYDKIMQTAYIDYDTFFEEM